MPTDLQTIELLLRGGAIGAFLGAAIAMARGPSTPARVTGFVFGLAAASHTLTQAPQLQPLFGLAWPLVWALSFCGSGLFWAFATELFEDRPKLDLRRFAPAALLLAMGLALLRLDGAPQLAVWIAYNLTGVVLLVHVVVVIWSGWRNDLVESRRRLRGPILSAAALYAMAVLVVQTAETFSSPASFLSPLAAATLFGLGLATVGALLRADPDLFAPAAAPTAAAPLASVGEPSPEEARLAARLERLMDEERAHRDDQLSMTVLAARLGTPEYRLRRLINRRLGYRNFNAFLNHWRLQEVREALADPAQQEVPVATIALDAGFRSLGPFNRAFKAQTGLTPTDYRRRALGAAAADAPPPGSRSKRPAAIG